MSRHPMRVLLVVGACLVYLVLVALQASGDHLTRSAEALLWSRESQEAERRFALAVRLNPWDTAAAVGRADAWLEAADGPGLGSPQQIESLETAVELYLDLLSSAPENPVAWAQLARSYQALAVARRASRSIDISALTEAGRLDEPEDRLAVEALVRALELEPHNYIYLNYLGDLHYATDRAQALEWYRRGTRVLPRLQAHAYLKDPRSVPDDVADVAVEGARSALGTGNKVPDTKVLVEIAWFRARRQQYEAAVGAVRESLAMEPPSAGYQWAWLGMWLYRLERVEEAQFAFRRSLEVDPARDSAHRGLGQIALYGSDLVLALEHFRVARDLVPDSLPAQLLLARTLVRAEHHDEAAAEFQRALHLSGGEIPAATALVELYRTLEIYDRALVYARRLADRYPEEQTFRRQVEELQAQLSF